jgi:DNA-binding transcriptional MocR family regulator
VSVHAMSWAKRQRTGSATRKLVLLTLADYADDNGICWPSQRTLADETELTDRSIRNALGDLEGIGLLDRRSRPPLSSGQRQTDLIILKIGATGRDFRRHSPAESDDRHAEPVSAKPSRNSPYQVRSRTSKERALGKTPPSTGGPAHD